MKPRYRHLLKYTGFAFLALLFVAVIGIAWLGGTQGGTHWLVEQSRRWIPGELNIGTLEGSLFGHLELHDVTYRDQGLDAQIDTVILDWFPSQLWAFNAWVKQLHVYDARIQLPPPSADEEAPSDEPFTLPDIELPVAVVVEDLQLKNIEIVPADGEPFLIESAELQAEVREYVTLSRFHVVSPLFEVSANGTATLTTPHPVDLTIDWSAAPPEVGALAGKATLQGDTNKLQLQHSLKQPATAELDATIQDALGAGNWQLTLTWPGFQWPLDTSQTAIARSQQGKLTGTGDLSNYQATLTTALDGEQIPAGQWALDVTGDLTQASITRLHGTLLQGELNATGQVGWQDDVSAQVDLNTTQLDLTELWRDWPTGAGLNTKLRATFADDAINLAQLQVDIQGAPQPTTLSAKGDINLSSDTPVLDVAMDWQHLAWPPTEAPDVQSTQGSAKVTGAPNAWQAVVAAHLVGKEIPDSQWQIEASGDETKANLAGVTGQLLDGELRLTGDVAWTPHVTWQAELSGEQLNPGKKWADWPGQLALSLRSQGNLKNDKLNATAEVSHIKGQLRDYPLQVQGNVAAQGDAYSVKDLSVRSGSTLITAQGKLDDTLQADWKIDASDLKTLHPAAAGRLQGEGKISGTLEKPGLTAVLNGESIEFEDFLLASLQTHVNVALAADAPLNLELKIGQVDQGEDVLLETLQLDGQGQLDAHELTLTAKLPKESATLKLDGGFDPEINRWEGLLTTLTATLNKLGTWTLQEAAALSASPEQLSLAESCLQRDDALICVQAERQDARQTLQARISALPFAFAKPFLPEDLNLESQLDGTLNARIAADGELRAESIFTVAPGKLTTVLDDQVQTFEFKGGELRGFVTDAGLAVGLGFELLENSIVQGALTLPGMTRLTPADEQILHGSVKLDFKDLAVLPGLVPQLGEVKGQVDLAMTIDGTIAQPDVRGEFLVKEGDVTLPDFGLHLEALNSALTMQGSTLDLALSAKSGDGELNINGDADISNPERWQARVNLKGEQFEAINSPEYRVLLSPDLTINTRPGFVDATGTLKIPEALLTPNVVAGIGEGGSTPVAVRASNDVVFVNEAPDKAQEEDAITLNWVITGQNRIELGDNVRVEVVGFESNIEGILDLVSRPNQLLPVASGSLKLVEGQYKAYGQDLDIKQGLVIFSDRPIDNPGLNIRASRTIRNDTNTPRVKEAGVHITGTAQNPKLTLYSDPTVEDRDVLSYIITGSAFGAGGDIKDSKLGLGTYLTDKLYVGFGFSPFDQTKVFNIRYDINERWGVESTVGDEDNGADVSYTIGR